MSLVIKAFYERNGESPPEIRRFAIPADASASFTYVFKKIAEIFPGLVTGHLKLHWKDEDGDLVLFTSDEELIVALGHVKDVFKVYIKDDNQTKSKANGDRGQLHPHVVCDGCESAVYGVRYKCLVCPDYDLCSGCEDKNTHPQHDMWKMVAPKRPSCGAGPGSMPFTVPPHFERWMSTVMSRCQQRQPCPQTKPEAPPGGENKEEASAQDQEEEQGSGKRETTPQEEYLKNIGQSVAAFLRPLGIDVDVDVEHNGRREGVNGGQGGPGGQAFWENFMSQFSQCPFNGGSQSQSKETGNMSDKEKMEKEGGEGEKKEEKKEQGSEDSWTLLSDGVPSPSSAVHPDPQIVEALEQMLLMGFTDDGGWLTRLLESKDGDISKVLDAIRPNRE